MWSDYFDMGNDFHTVRPLGDTSWLVFFTLAGEGLFRSSTHGSQICRAGDFWVYEPKKEQDYATGPCGRWRFHWCHFYPHSGWIPWLNHLPETGLPGLRGLNLKEGPLRAKLRREFEELHVNLRLGGRWRIELAGLDLARILLQAAETSPASSRRPFDDRVQAALRAIAETPAAKHTVAGLAKLAHLSPSRFAHLFRRETGNSVIDAVLQSRLREAVKRLEMTSQPVSEIAYACGFGSPFYFSTLFKRRHGASPRDYRKKIQVPHLP
jgi:AraC family transcriptional regulator of arabinose operon